MAGIRNGAKLEDCYTVPIVTEGIGRRIYDWRIENNVTRNALSVNAPIAYSKLWEMEVNGDGIDSVKVIERLADYMNVDRAWLLWGSPYEEYME